MQNEPVTAPTTLTPEQEAMVSGGALNAYNIVRSGCPTCTSGLPVAFLNIAAVVNPAPEVQAVG